MQNFFKSILQHIALACFAISLTILFLGMRSVLGVGGFCAEGGPCETAVHCPSGKDWSVLELFKWFETNSGLE